MIEARMKQSGIRFGRRANPDMLRFPGLKIRTRGPACMFLFAAASCSTGAGGTAAAGGGFSRSMHCRDLVRPSQR